MGEGAEALVQARGYSAQPQPADQPLPNRKEGKVLHPDLINENIRKAQYAVRGELYNRAVQLAAQGKEIIYTNGERAPGRMPAIRCPHHLQRRCCGLPSRARAGPLLDCQPASPA